MKRTVHYLLFFLSSVILFSCSYDDTEIWPEIERINSDFSNPLGIFILNEGSAFQEDGSLIYITSGKEVLENTYFNINGKTPGNVTQDLFIKDDKMYIISQNKKSSSDGMLLVADARTLKKEANYSDEMSSLSWPTHVAVLNEKNIFIRDNNGIYVFDSTTGKLTFVKGSGDALKNRMAVADHKVFAAGNGRILVLEADRDEIAKTIEIGADISGVLRAKDGNIWVSAIKTRQKPEKVTTQIISKIDSKNHSIIKSNELTEGSLYVGFGSSPGITAKGDTLYYSGNESKIYRHIFSIDETKLMVNAKDVEPDANIIYNTIAVHPVTGKVYMNTIKGYGNDFKINSILEFNFSGSKPELTNNFKDHTRFPAGIFFPANFN